MKTKNKILILALVGLLLLPSAITKAQNIDEAEQPTLINISISKKNGFVPKQFEAQAGKIITIELTNDDNSVHGLRFSEKSLRSLTMGVNPGQTTSITFEVPKKLKSYPFYCTAPGHKRKGETGTMIVVRPILTNPVAIDEDITAEDLEIEEPKMLSTNIFYPLKNLFNNVKIALTANPIKKAEMRLDLANEKLIEAKKLTEELNQPEKAIKAIESYKKETAKSIKIIENIAEKHQVKAQILSDKIIDNSFKQQKLIDGLEKKMDAKYSEDLHKAREKGAKYIGVVIDKIIPPEKIESKMVEIIEKQKGSEFKDFKNLEILKAVEEKVPEQAKQAIQKAQENTIQRLERKMETMDKGKEEEFKDYVKNIGGNEINHLKVIEDMARKEIAENVRQPIAIAREIAINKISDRIEKFSDEKQDNFLDNLKTEKIEDLRIIKELENNVSTQAKNKITQIKKEALQKISNNIIKNTDTKEKEEKYLANITDNNDIKQLEILKEIKDIIPESKKEFIQKATNKTIERIKDDIEKAKDDKQRARILGKIAGDNPEQIKIIKEISSVAPIMSDVMKKQTEKIQNKIRIIENESTLEQLRERIQQQEKEKGGGEIKQIKERIENKIKAITIEELMKKSPEGKERGKRPKKIEVNEAIQLLSKLKRSTNCIQVITPAKSPDGKTCINFPTPCDVPSGWKKVESCVQADKKEDIKELTCAELCKSLGYEKGICRKWAVVPSAKMGCRNNETKVSATSDCFVSTNLAGLGKACCCSTPENRIVPHRQEERQTEEPATYSEDKIIPLELEQEKTSTDKPVLNISPSIQINEQGMQEEVTPVKEEVSGTSLPVSRKIKKSTNKSNR
ncbi:hypothetical protein B6D52_01605 [Candidatus Parcubacteria bacterium 4484_255]|nr:MAG: hypothetical protein B6D52_01605 [Candidatus Parcubacteria bacterium 4484_255]